MRLLILILITCLIAPAIAQTTYRDQLTNRLKTETDQKGYLLRLSKSEQSSKKLATVCYELGQVYRNEAQIDSSEMYYRRSLRYARKVSRSNQDVGRAYEKIGMVFFDRGELDSALFYVEKSLLYFKDQELKAGALNRLGLINKYMSNPDVAIGHFLKALEIYQKEKDTANQVMVYSNVGALYRQLKDYRKGREYLLIGLDLAGDNEKYNKGRFLCQSNLASIYMLEKNFSGAIDLYTELISHSREQEQYLKLIVNQSNLAGCYAELGEDRKALTQFLGILKTMDERGIEKNKEAILANTAFCYEGLQNYDKALEFYHRALRMAKSKKISVLYTPIYEGLSSAHLKLGNPDSSVLYKDLQIAVRDSLDRVEKEKKVMELEAQHRNKELNADLNNVRSELNSAEKEKSFFATSFVYALIIGLIALVLVIALYLRYRKKKQLAQELTNQNVENQDEISTLTSSLGNKEEEIERLIEQNHSQKLTYPTNLVPLTEREKEVLLGVKDGLKDQEIADRLFISIATVRTHLRKAYVKIDARNRAEAISFISKYHF